MTKMKINSKNDYERNRVTSGNEPHRILQMLQEQALEKKAENWPSTRRDYSIIFKILIEVK